MKYLLITLALVTFQSLSFNYLLKAESYYILSDELDENLDSNTAQFTFRISNYQSEIVKTIRYSINDEEKTIETSDKMKIVEMVAPGEYDFKFLLSLRHEEIITKKIKIKPQHHLIIQLDFQSTRRNISVKKPVIYLYPEEETQIEIQLSTTGQSSFTYPEYKNGWSVLADSQGNITTGNETYNYLFWESEQVFDASLVDRNQGVIVAKKDLLTFLESSLNTFGFNAKERADFITYWIPRMNDATNLYIYFLFNDACDAFATLNISPKPAQIARFYMLWANAGTDYDEIGMLPQEIPTFKRDGFTVLEWGGAEIESKSKSKTID